MDAGLNRKSFTFGVPGIIIQIVGNVMMRVGAQNGLIVLLGLLVWAAGTALLMYGLSIYAKAKGHSPWLGLLGLLSCLGLLILALLPDKLKGPPAA